MTAPNFTSKSVACSGEPCHPDLQGLPTHTLAHHPAAVFSGASPRSDKHPDSSRRCPQVFRQMNGTGSPWVTGFAEVLDAQRSVHPSEACTTSFPGGRVNPKHTLGSNPDQSRSITPKFNRCSSVRGGRSEVPQLSIPKRCSGGLGR